jgi:competence protein ComEA
VAGIGFTVVKPLVAPAAAPVEIGLPRAKPAGASASTEGGAESAGPVVVYAAGAVKTPGVYKLAAGARVTDAVLAAGGPAPDADLDRVNLAAKVTDGERVYIPRKGEAGDAALGAAGVPDAAGTGAPAVLDLNTATAEQLDALPGVGPATAKAILDYRTQHRRFRSVDELLEVRGIGEAKLAQLKPLVRVG